MSNDEEAKLLASLGSSIQNMDAYEANVIDTAERNMAPQLTGIGFPPLHTMAPSGNPQSHLQDVQNLLQKTRKRILQEPTSTKLLLKQQMLLNLVQSVSTDMDFLIRPQEEFRQEIKRQKQLTSSSSSTATTATTTTTTTTITSSASTETVRPQNGEKSPPPPQVKDLDTTTPKNASARLEAIQNQRINSQQQQQQPRLRKRISWQQRKRSGDPKEENSEEEDDNNDENYHDSNQDYKQRLKKIRQDREKLRRKRRRQWKQGEEEEEEFEFDDSIAASNHQDDDDNNNNNNSKESLQKKKKHRSTNPPPPPKQLVTCPLCEISLEVPNEEEEDVDGFLSHHMSICQTTRTRRQRRTSIESTRRAAAAAVNYSETSNDNKWDTKSTANNSDSGDGDDDDADVTPTSDDSDDEILIADDVSDDSEENAAKSSRKRTSRSLPPAPRQTTVIDDWDEDDYEDRVYEWMETGVQDMKDMKERDVNETPPGEAVYDGGLVVPAWINDRLFPYQRTAVQWMWELHQQQAGGIIGDEMGLGKTVQIGAFLGSMASSRKLKSVLVISPATMLQHWLKEMAKWAPGLRRILIHQSGEGNTGMRRTISASMLSDADKWLKGCRRTRLFEAIDDHDLETRDPASFCGTAYAFVTTYENVRRNPDIWTNHRWSYVVIDEAQKIRNPDADITLVCKRLRTPHRLALSGTPIQNDLNELWSLFDFVFPGRLGTLPAFEQEFADPIKRGGYSNASPMQVQVAYRCALILKDLINPYLLRRLKKDIEEMNRMPGKKEQVLFCRLTNRQRMLYESFLQSDLVKNIMRGSVQLLGAITTLRKICNHPDLVCPPNKASFDSFLQKGSLDENDFNDYSDDEGSIHEEESLANRSGKLEVLAKILPLWHKQGHRVLIFCQWKKMLNIIQRFMTLKGWKFSRLDGDTNIASRQRLVDSFNGDDSNFAMLCTTRTGGVGLNLTGADRIILYDPDWNPQTDAQARERAWRFGQEKEVVIFRLISAGTVEEKIYQRQIFKTALSNKVLQDARQRRLFSQKDLKDLFSLKADSGSVISGSDGLTETGELTKGDGYVDPDEDPSTTVSSDDGETMRTVLKSRGLAGVFDHGIVENHDVVKKASVREMEAKAKRIAREAASSLQESVTEQQSFTPTWTGSVETQGGRFGSSMPSGVASAPRSAATRAGISMSSTKASSDSLLASIRERNQDLNSNGERKVSDTKQYTDLLKRIRDFVKHQAPTTDEILNEFESVSNYDAAIFRRLLKSVAKCNGGRWRLK